MTTATAAKIAATLKANGYDSLDKAAAAGASVVCATHSDALEFAAAVEARGYDFELSTGSVRFWSKTPANSLRNILDYYGITTPADALGVELVCFSRDEAERVVAGFAEAGVRAELQGPFGSGILSRSVDVIEVL